MPDSTSGRLLEPCLPIVCAGGNGLQGSAQPPVLVHHRATGEADGSCRIDYCMRRLKTAEGPCSAAQDMC